MLQKDIKEKDEIENYTNLDIVIKLNPYITHIMWTMAVIDDYYMSENNQSRLLMTLKKALENTVVKEENACNQHVLLFPHCFQLYHKRNCYLSNI